MKILTNNKTGHAGITKTKSGSFEVYKTIGGKWKYLGCRKTLEQAIKLRKDEI